MTAWVRHQGSFPKRRVFWSPNIERNGSASSLDDVHEVVRVRRVGFAMTENWGEGNWTARDLR